MNEPKLDFFHFYPISIRASSTSKQPVSHININ